MEEFDVLDTIIDGIDPLRKYRPIELVPLLGFSRAAIYRFIKKDWLRPYVLSGHLYVEGAEAIFFCKHHRDWLEQYSSFGGHKKMWKPLHYMGAHKRRGRPRIHRRMMDLKSEVKADVFYTCDQIKNLCGSEYVSARAVRNFLHRRTEDVCPFVKQWKLKEAGIKPKKAA